ncbi:MAG TPA: hypothetical protein VJP79_08585 [Nitrososphaera sp.]|nr:hypothetical protein [Nitrososphaera sp.]
MASDEETHTYEETVNKTSDPEPRTETRVTSTGTTKTTTSTASSSSVTPDSDIQTYEVKTVSPSEEEESVSAKAREAGRSLKDLVYSLGRKTRDVTEEKTRELKEKSVDISSTADARDIQHLGGNVENLITVFEDTMTEIRREPYNEQERLLTGYRKLLEEQINVINARMDMARRLKPGA